MNCVKAFTVGIRILNDHLQETSCTAPKAWPVTVLLQAVPFQAKVVPLRAKLLKARNSTTGPARKLNGFIPGPRASGQ